MKVWDRAGIKLETPGSAVRLTSVPRHVTDCATRPSEEGFDLGGTFNYLPTARFIQASLCKIQGLFKDFHTVFKD